VYLVHAEKCPRFQSLIGRLKTVSSCTLEVQASSFQSLIGRLKTKACWMSASVASRFQSLIGRLKTSGEDANQAFLLHVSIPHR